jgi:hypothetical protein
MGGPQPPGRGAGWLKSHGGKVLDAFNPLGDGIGKIPRPGTGSAYRPGSSGGGSLMGAKNILSPFVSMAGRFGLHTSSGRRPGAITSSGNVSWHSSGNAVDEAGTPAGMLGYFRYLKANFGSRLRELIYTPGGVGIKDGKPVPLHGPGRRGPLRPRARGVHGRRARPDRRRDRPDQEPVERAGGRTSAANMAAAIAMAESSGNPSASNRNTDGSIDRGLWQINSIHGRDVDVRPSRQRARRGEHLEQRPQLESLDGLQDGRLPAVPDGAVAARAARAARPRAARRSRRPAPRAGPRPTTTRRRSTGRMTTAASRPSRTR